MRAPKGRWDVAPTLREAKSVKRPVFMCAGGHRFLVLSDHASDSVKCPLCDQPAGLPMNATLLNANGQTIVAEAPGLEIPVAVGQAMPLAATASTTLVTAPPGGENLQELEPAQLLEESPTALPNPYAVAEGVASEAATQPEEIPLPPEKIWPLFLVVGGAAAALVGIAAWLKHAGT
jgi:hypothetical protein